MITATLGAQRIGMSGLQVHAAGIGDAALIPAEDGRRLDAEMLGGAGQAAEVADDSDGFGVAGLLVHAPILAEPKFGARGKLAGPTNGRRTAPKVGRRTISGMSNTTLKDRLAAAMDGLPRGAQARLAAACGVSAPSVNGWLSGETKTLGAETVFAAARFLNVNPEWLATGKGVMRPSVGAGGAAAEGSQPARLDAFTLGRAMRFARLWLTIRGDGQPLEKHPDLVLAAARAIETLEANIDSDDELTEVMGKLAAMGGADGIRRETVGGAGADAGGGAG